jgi:isocitrate dehydrogenase (NAD+)
LFGIELDIAWAHDPQIPRAQILVLDELHMLADRCAAVRKMLANRTSFWNFAYSASARAHPDVAPCRRDSEQIDACDDANREGACVESAAVERRTIVVLVGDQTGQELLEEALRVIAPDVIGLEFDLPRYDLSLENRRATRNQIVHEAAAAIRDAGLGLKAATVTPEGKGDVGSPNRIIREEIGGSVIVRNGRRIPGVVPFGGVHAPISIVRMAVGDAYGAKEWREGEGDDEVAFRTERIERRISRSVAEFAFRLAERTGAKVFGGPKYTVSPVYEGMLKEEMDAAAARHPDVPYEPQLIDATFALLIAAAGDPLVIPALNRDGDILSDLVLPLFGSIAGSESLVVALDTDYAPKVVMAEAAHGTAPSLQGKNVANPMAMILAAAALLTYAGEQAQEAGRAIREACLEAVAAGCRTADLGGHHGSTEFTDEVIRRTQSKLEVWATL